MSEQENLLPCPFCGECGQLMRRTEALDDDALIFWVACLSDKCRAHCRTSMESKASVAIAAWNTRTTPVIECDVVERVIRAIAADEGREHELDDANHVANYRRTALSAIAAIQPAIDKAAAEERVRSVKICRSEDEYGYAVYADGADIAEAIERGGEDA